MRPLLPLSLFVFALVPTTLYAQSAGTTESPADETAAQPRETVDEESSEEAAARERAALLRDVQGGSAGGASAFGGGGNPFGGGREQPAGRGSSREQGTVSGVLQPERTTGRGGAGGFGGGQPAGGGSQADDARREQFRRMMEERSGGALTASSTESTPRRTLVIPIRNAPARELAESLTRALGGGRDVVIVPESMSNSLVISAPEADFDRMMATVQELVQVFDRSPKVLAVEVAIVELGHGGNVAGPFEGSLAEVLEALKKKNPRSVERVSLTTIENQSTSVQLGASRAVPNGSSQSFATRGGVPQRVTNYQTRDFGTIVRLTGRSTGDEVVMDITVERTKLGEVPPTEEEAEPIPPTMTTLTLQSTMRVTPGEVVLVGSRGSDDDIVAVLATVHVAAGGQEAASAGPRTSSFGGGGAARAEPPAESRELKIFSLKFAEAASMANVLHDVFGGTRTPPGIAVDERINALVVSGEKSSMETIEALITRLDVPKSE